MENWFYQNFKNLKPICHNQSQNFSKFSRRPTFTPRFNASSTNSIGRRGAPMRATGCLGRPLG